MKLANLTSSYRADLIKNTYKNWLQKKARVLDVGCGTGVVSKKLETNFSLNLTGCDIENYLLTNIKYKDMVVTNKLPFKRNSFDVVMFNDVLHHIEFQDQKKLLKEALRVADVVLLFELRQTVYGKFFDWLLNKIHNPNMNIPYAYNSIDEWVEIINELRVRYEIKEVKKPLFYPFHHIGFKLYKNE